MAIGYEEDGRYAGALHEGEEATRHVPAASLTGSRTAIISLIDRLSHRGIVFLAITAIGVLVLSGFSFIEGLAAGRPWLTGTSVLAWLVMTALPLHTTARLLRLYRTGLGFSGRPMSWRRRHTVGLAGLSAALGCGAMMLAPMGGATLLAGTVLLCLILGAGQLAHASAALAASLPGIGLATVAFYTSGTTLPGGVVTLSVIASGVAACIAAGLWRYRQLVRHALEQHPRRETPHIKARQRKTSSAYNPYKLRPQTDPDKPKPYLYRPETAGQ